MRIVLYLIGLLLLLLLLTKMYLFWWFRFVSCHSYAIIDMFGSEYLTSLYSCLYGHISLKLQNQILNPIYFLLFVSLLSFLYLICCFLKPFMLNYIYYKFYDSNTPKQKLLNSTQQTFLKVLDF